VPQSRLDHESSSKQLVGRIEQSNRLALGPLVEQLRSPVGVIPFVGAGTCAEVWLSPFFHDA